MFSSSQSNPKTDIVASFPPKKETYPLVTDTSPRGRQGNETPTLLQEPIVGNNMSRLCGSGFMYCSYIAITKQLLPQLHQRRALATLVLRSLGNRGYMRMPLPEVAHPAAQYPRAVRVNHTHLRQAA